MRNAQLQRWFDGALQGEGFVLNYIARRRCEVLPGEIGSEMNVSSARIAQTLNSIEKKGWIIRRIDKNDRRKILIELTLEGRDAALKHHQALTGHIAMLLSLLGEQDAKEYVRITGKLAESLLALPSKDGGAQQCKL
jgi:DNA-binding MarR family transcriptional regulator